MQDLELIDLGLLKYKSYDALCNRAGVPKSTLWRRRTGKVKKLRRNTLEKLVIAIYGQED